MDEITIQVLIDGDSDEIFRNFVNSNNIISSSVNNKNFSFSFKEEDKNNELNLGSKFKMHYSFFKNIIKGDTDIIVTQFWKPYSYTEIWDGGIFDSCIHTVTFEQKGDKVLVNYSIDCSIKFLPFKNKIIKTKIIPSLKGYIGNRLSNAKKA